MFLRIRLIGITEAQKGTDPNLPFGSVASIPIARGKKSVSSGFLTCFRGLLQALFASSSHEGYA